MTRMTGQNGSPLSSMGRKIVSSISTFVLNTLTLKKGLFLESFKCLNNLP